MENLPDITEVLDPAPVKRRGRKPGSPRVPGSGRQPGSKNRVVADVREMILARGKPIELLCDISRGVKVRVGPQAGPGEPQYAYPSLQERAAAAKILLDKLVPAAPASLPGEQTPPPPVMTDIELARLMCFTLARGVADAGASLPLPPPKQAAPVAPADPFAGQREQQAAEIAATQDSVAVPAVSAAMTDRERDLRELQAAPWRGGDHKPDFTVVRFNPRPR